MPLTTNFSEEFYDRLGHEVVDEMVSWFNQTDNEYRTQLRDLNHDRLEARIDRFLAERDARWERRLKERFDRILKWMFFFWITTLAGMVGMSIAIVRSLR